MTIEGCPHGPRSIIGDNCPQCAAERLASDAALDLVAGQLADLTARVARTRNDTKVRIIDQTQTRKAVLTIIAEDDVNFIHVQTARGYQVFREASAAVAEHVNLLMKDLEHL